MHFSISKVFSAFVSLFQIIYLRSNKQYTFYCSVIFILSAWGSNFNCKMKIFVSPQLFFTRQKKIDLKIRLESYKLRAEFQAI